MSDGGRSRSTGHAFSRTAGIIAFFATRHSWLGVTERYEVHAAVDQALECLPTLHCSYVTPHSSPRGGDPWKGVGSVLGFLASENGIVIDTMAHIWLIYL